MVILVFEFRSRACFSENLLAGSCWNTLFHILFLEYMNWISFWWTWTRRLSHTSVCFSCMDLAFILRPGLVWVKASWNMNNGDVGSSALTDWTCKSMPTELPYLLIWMQIYKPSKENHAAMVYVTYQKIPHNFTVEHWQTPGVTREKNSNNPIIQNHLKEEKKDTNSERKWEKRQK